MKQVFKKGLVLIFFTLGSLARADFTYTCLSQSENRPYDVKKINLTINESLATVTSNRFKNPETYYVLGKMTANGRLKNFYPLDLMTKSNSYPGEPLDPLYVDEKLTEGGDRLESGKMGGFLTVGGWDYPYAAYLCER